MNYEETIRETEEMIRGIMIREQIAEWVLIGLCVVLVGLIVIVWVKGRKSTSSDPSGATFPTGEGLRPTVTEDVQIVNGVEFHRMGPVGRWES